MYDVYRFYGTKFVWAARLSLDDVTKFTFRHPTSVVRAV